MNGRFAFGGAAAVFVSLRSVFDRYENTHKTQTTGCCVEFAADSVCPFSCVGAAAAIVVVWKKRRVIIRIRRWKGRWPIYRIYLRYVCLEVLDKFTHD